MLKTSSLALLCALALVGCGQSGGEGGKDSTASPESAEDGPAGEVADNVPALKPGKWRVTVVKETGPDFPAQNICLSEADARAKKGLGERAGELPCSDRAVTREGDAVVTRAVCNIGGVTRTIETRATGDFQADYWVAYAEKLDPPPEAGPPEVRRRIHARWMGEC